MFDPLGLLKKSDLALKLKAGFKHNLFICCDLQNHMDDYTKVARYTLKDIRDNKSIDIEISKDKNNNFHIFAYDLIETKPFSHTFSSILGVDSIGYNNLDNFNTHTLYHRINYPNEKLELYKYICDTETIPTHPSNIGYEQDGEGRWYMLIYRSNGRVKKFTPDDQRRSWEYETQNQKRLLVELNENKKIDESYFHIYNGQKLNRRELKLVEQ